MIAVSALAYLTEFSALLFLLSDAALIVLLAGSTILTDLCYTLLGSISAWIDCIPIGLISRSPWKSWTKNEIGFGRPEIQSQRLKRALF
jgi:hypothetical protein